MAYSNANSIVQNLGLTEVVIVCLPKLWIQFRFVTVVPLAQDSGAVRIDRGQRVCVGVLYPLQE